MRAVLCTEGTGMRLAVLTAKRHGYCVVPEAAAGTSAGVGLPHSGRATALLPCSAIRGRITGFVSCKRYSLECPRTLAHTKMVPSCFPPALIARPAAFKRRGMCSFGSGRWTPAPTANSLVPTSCRSRYARAAANRQSFEPRSAMTSASLTVRASSIRLARIWRRSQPASGPDSKRQCGFGGQARIPMP